MTGATPNNYRQKLRGQEPRSLLTSLLSPVSVSQPSPILVSPAVISTTAASSTTPAATSAVTTSSGNPIMATMPHVKLEEFSGTANGQSWWQDFLNFSNFYSFNDERKCQLLPFYLEGEAKLWYRELPDGDRNNLTRIKASFDQRFSSQAAFDVSVLQIAQAANETVSSYVTRVQAATTHLNLPTSVVVAIAVNGLHCEIRQIVYNKEPTTLQEVRHQATLAEKSLSANPVDVNIAAKVDQLTNLVATLITKATPTPLQDTVVASATGQQDF
ncbi:uncharacterized protein [Haliotis asinina]|uniref:uncharacterized protein n=1 Tax=Haliotis asinina TaxID=109174 RepID=UPI0035323AF3